MCTLLQSNGSDWKLEIKPTVQRRILQAIVDLAILKALASQAMTGYGISGYFTRKFGITVGPSMIYSNLAAMERKEWIKCVRNRNGRTYSLAQQGQAIATSLPAIAEEIHRFIRIMLG